MNMYKENDMSVPFPVTEKEPSLTLRDYMFEMDAMIADLECSVSRISVFFTGIAMVDETTKKQPECILDDVKCHYNRLEHCIKWLRELEQRIGIS